MSELIEWKKQTNSNGVVWYGFIGEASLFSTWALALDDYIIHFGGKVYNAESFPAAKAKAEELLAAWLKEASLIVKPVKCGKCGDSGEFENEELFGRCSQTITCPCTKDPHSLWYFNNVIMGD